MMKNFTLLFCLLSFFACQNTEQNNTAVEEKTVTCDFSDRAVRDGQYLLRDLQRLVLLTTDESNPQGILEVYNNTNCTKVNQIAFPAFGDSVSTYRPAQIIYNNQSKYIGIYGGGRVYLYDAAADKAGGPLLPRFLTPRPRTVSGEIVRLEVWEDYLIGFAAEKGAFAFDLKNPNNPAAILPSAEYARPDGTYSSLFLLPSQGEKETMQAVFPRYDAATETFGIVSLFKKPRALALAEGELTLAEKINLKEGEKTFTVNMDTQSLEE